MSVFPATDVEFKRSVESALAVTGGRQIDDPGVLAAAMALMRPDYPTVVLQLRGSSQARHSSVEAYRDVDTLDCELAQRARAGDEQAMGQLYDRHQRLVYAVASHASPDFETAAAVVVTAFRSVLIEQPEQRPMRIRLASAARDAALRAAGTDSVSRSTLQRAVIELSRGHGLAATEIAQVMRLEMPVVRKLANDALETLRSAQPHG